MNRAFVAGSNGPKEDPLRFAENDAKDIERCLTSRRCQFTVNMPGYESTIEDFRRLLYLTAESCTHDDTFICFYSGHGILDKNKLFLVWHETEINRLLMTAVPVSAFTEAMEYSKAKNKLLVLDCCHAGAATAEGFRELSKVSVKKVIEPSNYLVLMASDRFNSARELDSIGGGFLSQELCAALERSYHSAVGDDHRLSVTDVKEWLHDQAVRHNEENGPQLAVEIPYLFGQLGSNFYIDVPPSEQWHPVEFKFEPLDEQEFVLLPFRYRANSDEDVAVWLGKYPVLNSAYREFVPHSRLFQGDPQGDFFERDQWRPGFRPWEDEAFNHPDQPVVCVSLDQAWEYAHWFFSDHICGLSARDNFSGACIISPALWDMVAFGTEYPSWKPMTWLDGNNIAYGPSNAPARIDRSGRRTNQLGIADMIGNVWEWCENPTDFDYARPKISVRPTDVDGRSAEMRGGGFLDDLRVTKPFVRAWEPSARKMRHNDLGFRIALLSPIGRLPKDLRESLEAFDSCIGSSPPTGKPARANEI